MGENEQRHVVLAITGASGARYALRVLDGLLAAGRVVHVVVSPLGQRLLRDEAGVGDIREAARGAAGCVCVHDFRDVGGRLASGSFVTEGMAICPCSGNTLGSIAGGIADNCITRAAAVHLKERRRLVLVHREMPVSRIDLENMLKVDAAGAVVCPASPGFYLNPQLVDDLVDFVAGKVLDLLGVEHAIGRRWEPIDPPGTSC